MVALGKAAAHESPVTEHDQRPFHFWKSCQQFRHLAAIERVLRNEEFLQPFQTNPAKRLLCGQSAAFQPASLSLRGIPKVLVRYAGRAQLLAWILSLPGEA